MHQRDDGLDAVLPAAADHLAVMLDLRLVKLALLRLDARPLNGEAVGIQPGPGEEPDVLLVAVVVVAGRAAGLGEAGMRQLLLQPVVAMDVVALDLMGGGRRADKKAFRESHVLLLLIKCSSAP